MDLPTVLPSVIPTVDESTDVSRATSPPLSAEATFRTAFEKSMSEDDCCSSFGDASSGGDLLSPRTRTQRERLGPAPAPKSERIKTLLESISSSRKKSPRPLSRGPHEPPANPMQ